MDRLTKAVAIVVLGCSCTRATPPTPEVTPSPKPGAPSAPIPAASTPPAASPTAAAFAGTLGETSVSREGSPVAVLTDVRTSGHAGFDRVVFEFDGHVPGYHIEYVDRPLRSCGSGETVPVDGDAWLRVRFQPANSHTDAGQATVTFRERRLDMAVVRELQSLCDFEAQVEWAIGVGSPNRYRVLELTEPPRLAVDIDQRRR